MPQNSEVGWGWGITFVAPLGKGSTPCTLGGADHHPPFSGPRGTHGAIFGNSHCCHLTEKVVWANARFFTLGWSQLQLLYCTIWIGMCYTCCCKDMNTAYVEDSSNTSYMFQLKITGKSEWTSPVNNPKSLLRPSKLEHFVSCSKILDSWTIHEPPTLNLKKIIIKLNQCAAPWHVWIWYK